MQSQSVGPQRVTRAAGLLLCLAMAGGAVAGDTPKAPSTADKKAPTRQVKQTAKPAQSAAAKRQPGTVAVATPSEEVQQLKQQLAAQQQQIEQLRIAIEAQRQMLEKSLQAHAASPERDPGLAQLASLEPVLPAITGSGGSLPALPPQPKAVSPDDLQAVKGQIDQRMTKLEGSVADTQKKTEGKLKGLGNFSLSGDVRVRYETFLQDGTPARNRERIRARLNFKGNVTDDIVGELSLASGGLDDAISTNQTVTSFYTRKPVGIDLAYLTVNPKGFKSLTLSAGKMRYPWYRTQLTFDHDLNPEGISQTLSFTSKSVLQNVTLVGFQMPFNEVSGSHDSLLLGGQLQMNFKPADKFAFGLYASGMNFNRVDPIARAIAGKTLGGNPQTNAVVKDADGNVIGYASKFAYLELALKGGYDLSKRWPFAFGFDFVNNTRAASSERTAYLGEVSFGQTRNPKDIRFGYQYFHIERDAVLAAFNFSDLRQGTDVQNHVFVLGYQINKNVTGEWTYLLGKRLSDPLDRWLSRMQFDMSYKF